MSTVFRIAELDHVVFRCRDQNLMLAFYTGVLGLTEERRLDAIKLVQLRAGRSMVDLVPAHGELSEPAMNVDHVCLGVEADDMAALVAHLKTRGVDVIDGPVTRYGAHGNGLSIYIHDPE